MQNLTQRLLAAARHAYEIDADGVVPDAGWSPAPYGYVGYTDKPIGFRAGLDNQDGGFTATIPEGVVVSIRGTSPPRLIEKAPLQVVADWACDAVASLMPASGNPPAFPGKVHLGFLKSFTRVWQKLSPAVHANALAYQKSHGGKELAFFVTGHSKGGAICALVAWTLKQAYPDAKIVVRSFAGARVGDEEFATAYNRDIDHIRYEYDDDIVPHLPLSPDVVAQLPLPRFVGSFLTIADVGYGQVGGLGFIQADETIITDDTKELCEKRVAALVACAEQRGGFDYIVKCHGVDPPGDGYYKAQYPG